VLELCTELTHWAEDPNTPGSRVRVTVVDDLDSALLHLIPTVREIGGLLLDVREIAAQGLPDVVSDGSREDRIIAALNPGGIVFGHDADDRRRAYHTAEAGQRYPSVDPLLGLATAALHARLAETDGLILLAYDEASMGVPDGRRAWTFARGTLADLAEKARRVVIVCGIDSIDYVRHCGAEPSAIRRLVGGEYLKRNDPEVNERLIRTLARTSAGHTVLFLAAGFSVSSGVPLGNQVRDVALREYLGDDVIPESGLPAAFYSSLPSDRLLDEERGVNANDLARRLTLERVLREARRHGLDRGAIESLAAANTHALANPGAAVRHLGDLLSLPGRRFVIVTVNFDQLVEVPQAALVRVFGTDNQFRDAAAYVTDYLDGNAAEVPVLKIHGTIEAPDSLVADSDTTHAGLAASKIAALEAATTSPNGPVPFVYVGSSMRDLDLAPFLSAPALSDRINEFWVAPFPADTVVEFIARNRRSRWQENRLAHEASERLITVGADQFLEQYVAHGR